MSVSLMATTAREAFIFRARSYIGAPYDGALGDHLNLGFAMKKLTPNRVI